MIRFLKEIYLTGFAIIYNASRTKESYKAGGATSFLSAVEWFVLLGIIGYVEMLLNKRILVNVSGHAAILSFFVLFLINGYILCVRDYGIKFADEFGKLEKSRRTRLTVRFVIAVLVAIAFIICSAIAHHHFLGIK